MPRRMLESGLSAHSRRRYEKPAKQVSGDNVKVFTPELEKETPPEGVTTIAALMKWVGESRTRAQVVLELENEKAEADRRKTLVSQLEGILSEDLI